MQDLKTQNKPKNLRTGCHFYNENMEFDVYNGEASDNNTIKYLIPLNKHILEPLGFEAVCDDYTSEMYFQRDIEGYRVRTIPLGARIIIIDLNIYYFRLSFFFLCHHSACSLIHSSSRSPIKTLKNHP